MRSHGGRRYLPWVFTEHGALMVATVLNSPKAVAMSVYVVRAFVQMRDRLAANLAFAKRIAEIDRTPPDPPRRHIGFHDGTGTPESGK